MLWLIWPAAALLAAVGIYADLRRAWASKAYLAAKEERRLRRQAREWMRYPGTTEEVRHEDEHGVTVVYIDEHGEILGGTRYRRSYRDG